MHPGFATIAKTFAMNMTLQILRSLPALILGFSIVLLLSYELFRSYSSAREDAERNVFNLVHIMSEQMARTIQSVDVNLQDISGELESNPDLPDNDPAFRARLHKRLAAMPFVRALFVIGRDGTFHMTPTFPARPGSASRTGTTSRSTRTIRRTACTSPAP